MNQNIDYLVQQLLGKGFQGQQPQQPMMPYDQMRRYLRTAQGREAARAAIDRIIVDFNVMGQQYPMPHQEVFKMISAMMQHGNIDSTEPLTPQPQEVLPPHLQGPANDQLLGLREPNNLPQTPSPGMAGESPGGLSGLASPQLGSPPGYTG